MAVGFSGAVASEQAGRKEAVNDAATDHRRRRRRGGAARAHDGLLTGDKAAFARLDRAVRDQVLGRLDRAGEDLDRRRADRLLRRGAADRPDASRSARTSGRSWPSRRPGPRSPTSTSRRTPSSAARASCWRSTGRCGRRGSRCCSRPTRRYEPGHRAHRASCGAASPASRSPACCSWSCCCCPCCGLLDRLRSAQAQREALLQRAVDASTRSGGGSPPPCTTASVQELAATSFVVAGAAERAERRGDRRWPTQLRIAADTVATSIGGLRSLLVDIYPPSLADAGLAAALADLVAAVCARRDIDVRLEVADELPEPRRRPAGRLVFRVAQECCATRPSTPAPSVVEVSLGAGRADGRPRRRRRRPRLRRRRSCSPPAEGHFGLRLLADLAAVAGAMLAGRSAPGRGHPLAAAVRP